MITNKATSFFHLFESVTHYVFFIIDLTKIDQNVHFIIYVTNITTTF